jgi:hypothetical protein
MMLEPTTKHPTPYLVRLARASRTGRTTRRAHVGCNITDPPLTTWVCAKTSRAPILGLGPSLGNPFSESNNETAPSTLEHGPFPLCS